MEQVTELLKTTLSEVEKLLSSRSVVGEPIKVGDETIIPLMSLGFGFGAGGGKGTDKSSNAGEGAGTGAGAGIRPVAVILIDAKGQARVQPVTGGLGDALGKLASSVGEAVSSGMEKRKDRSKHEGH